ncbi:winged helix-turn-helix transcriptional regulator [Humibacter antri]
MPVKKTYGELGDACATAHSLDVIGDRWSLIVVRELILGPRRFADLLSAVIGITPSALAGRLRDLQNAGVVEQTTLDDLAGTRAYRLTPWGSGLEDVMRSMARWAHGSPAFPVPGTGLTPDGVIVAMRTMTPPDAHTDVPVHAEWELTDVRQPDATARRYRLAWHRGGFDLAQGRDDAADVRVAGDSTAWAAVVFMGLPVEQAERDGILTVDGDRAALKRVLALYSAPPAG